MSAGPASTVEAAVEHAAPELIDHINTSHEDSLLLVGRILGGRGDATSARLTSIDVEGLDLVLTGPTGEHAARVDFIEPIRDVTEVSARATALVLSARERSGEPGQTTIEREVTRLQSIRTMLTSVAAVEDVHPHLRRITFRGGDLTTFRTLGPDTFLYVLLPPPGRDELTIDRSFTWEAYREMPDDVRPVGAYYTLRAWRPETAELDMLFVLHEPAGPASGWAASAKPGDPVALWGPREAFEPMAGTDWYLLVADDTGLPAVAVILETLPAGVPIRVVAEVDSPGERQDLAERPGTEITWVYRNGAAPGTVAGHTIDAVRALELPEGTGYVWGGGESRMMTAVRRYVRDEVGLSRDQVNLIAYWRHASAPPEDG
ncbi:MAG: SIP domain-containing protein [Actinomycetota bacterium]|nr:SIP domain-containing protein [Actinomycetota bacterium]